MQIEAYHLVENKPFPNNALPVILYKNALELTFMDNPSYTPQDVLDLFTKNGYSNGWLGGVLDRHHFHSNTHEALACVSGEARLQLGGPHSDIFQVRKGDVVLLPAGTAHKRLDQSQDFQIVGGYPEGRDYDMHYGDEEGGDYEAILESISQVPLAKTDPVTGSPSELENYWS